MAKPPKKRGPNPDFQPRPDPVMLDLAQLEAAGDADDLCSYLIGLVKQHAQPQHYEAQFAKHLASPEPALRQAAVFCLLFALKIDHPTYRAHALTFVCNPAEDEEVRRWATAGRADPNLPRHP